MVDALMNMIKRFEALLQLHLSQSSTPVAHRVVDWLRWLPGCAVLGCLLVPWLVGCRTVAPPRALQRYYYAELHMATMFELTFYAPDQTTADHAAEAAFRRIGELDDMMTDYDPRSELMRLCQQPPGTPVRVSQDLFQVLQQAQVISMKSGGAFDITVGPLVRLWRDARKTHTLPSPSAIAAAKKVVGYDKIRLDPQTQTVTLAAAGMKLDLGGIAKGLAADDALAVLRARGIRRAMVAASGDIAVGDPPPGHAGWAIGIQSIDQPPGGLTRSVLLKNAGISTSGDTEQYVEIGGQRYSHIVDPKTGTGLTERIGVTIVAPNGTLSDSLATAVSVMGLESGLALVESWPGMSALIVRLTPKGKESIESSRFKRLRRS